MLLLMVAWRTPDCSLPNDDKFLGRAIGDRRAWPRVKDNILPFFRLGDDGRLRQKRLTREHLHVTDLKTQSSAAGRSSALKRKELMSTAVERTLNGEGNGKATPRPRPILSDKEPDGSLSVQQSERNDHDRSKRGSRLPSDWEPNDEDSEFAQALGVEPRAAAEEFRDYWCAVPGTRGLKLDWSATFRNSCRKVSSGVGRRVSGKNGQSDGGVVAAFGRVLARSQES